MVSLRKRKSGAFELELTKADNHLPSCLRTSQSGHDCHVKHGKINIASVTDEHGRRHHLCGSATLRICVPGTPGAARQMLRHDRLTDYMLLLLGIQEGLGFHYYVSMLT
jgi:hypothetical protein